MGVRAGVSSSGNRNAVLGHSALGVSEADNAVAIGYNVAPLHATGDKTFSLEVNVLHYLPMGLKI